MTETTKCCKKLWYKGSYRGCSRSGKVNYDGKWFCKQHDPVAITKRLQKKLDENKQYWTTQERVREIGKAKEELLRAALSLWDHPAVTKYREQVYGKGGK